LEFWSEKRGRPKHVYLMDMNDLYLVVVRLPGWEFMAEASHINAKKAVRGLAADLQDFHEEGQRSSAAQLMQQGAAAVAVAAIEDARQAPTGERMELELAERRFDLKRKIEDWDQSLKERQKPWARDV
jgi:aminoglycoside phosphotransferase